MLRLARLLCLLPLAAAACSAAAPSSAPDTLSSAAAKEKSGTIIVTASGSKSNNEVFASVGIGFTDSSFDGDTKAFCYAGSVEDVCSQVDAYATKMKKNYGEGAHDTIDLTNCTIDGDNVSLKYNLSDDYGGNVDRDLTMTACQISFGSSINDMPTVVYRSGVAATDKKVAVSAAVGFEDSSLDGDKKGFCFTGDVNGVCKQINDYAQQMQLGSMEVLSCDVSKDPNQGDKVVAFYHLTDDNGGDLEIGPTIERCYDARQ